MMFSIKGLEFAAPMGVKLRGQKSHGHYGNVNQVNHKFRFWIGQGKARFQSWPPNQAAQCNPIRSRNNVADWRREWVVKRRRGGVKKVLRFYGFLLRRKI
jgi:hypothetical protein